MKTERHFINKKHKYYKEIDQLAFLSKNIYNSVNYIIRQYYFDNNNSLISFVELNKQMKNEDFRKFSSNVSMLICRRLYQNWECFFKAEEEYKINPEKFTSKPHFPHYKEKKTGRNILIYDIGSIGRKPLRKGIIKLSQTNIEIPTKQKNIVMVTITKTQYGYNFNVIYDTEVEAANRQLKKGLRKQEKITGEKPKPRIKQQKLKKPKKDWNYCGIDLGVNNLATLTSDKFKPIIINGRPVKSINQYYNKKRAELQAISGLSTSKRLEKLTSKRNHKIEDYMHKATKIIIRLCSSYDIDEIVIGKNNNWKHEVNLGNVNNQNFVSIPYNKFVHMLTYKAEELGIKVTVTEESYTSKSSFIDNDVLQKYEKGIKHTFSGKRISRALYRTKEGKIINSDVNGSYNIIRKVNKDFRFVTGIDVMPLKIVDIYKY